LDPVERGCLRYHTHMLFVRLIHRTSFAPEMMCLTGNKRIERSQT
jgi:hypothetical protein